MQEVILMRRIDNGIHLPFHVNNKTVKLTYIEKHLGLQLDNKLSFNEGTNNKISNATKFVVLVRKLQPILPIVQRIRA